ncbi:hypothetical protein PGT21_036621 [Puccinia graminis f. sp. tritici]|uniref:Uncharacterized protein n=1 Tax=Puccinia graminis f. sp. tritici TaxID=56615 RepID=A0A5B0Q116_PUCGR|nr:hypothetical protein PGTUg99_007736 [Puccinia graminis f. sp. tritici]KAA1119967.1 hypothetical protein PGT21_036621 [Puccinia graminis f. sp. tritici]
MLLKSLCMAVYALNHCMFSSSLAKPVMKRSIERFGMEGSSSVEESPFHGPLYESNEYHNINGDLHIVSWYCTPPEITFHFNGKDRKVTYHEFLMLGDSDGISKSDKQAMTNALISKEQGSKVIGMSQIGNQPISAEEKNRKWPNGPPRFIKTTDMIHSNTDGRKIVYRYFRTTPVAEKI